MIQLIEKQIQTWCENNGWTDYFIHDGEFYAFPPEAVIPVPIPMQLIKGATLYNIFRYLWVLLLCMSG
jgi:hypothetical protein